MSDAAAVQAMEALQSCRCCLRRPPEKGLKTLYDTLGKTENYWDMLKECFDIHLNVGNDECGICEVCVARLRDATEFKLQVQQSQVQLKALLEKALQEKDKKPNLIKVELVEEDHNADETMIQDSGSVKSEGDDLVSNILFTVETLYGQPVSGDIEAPFECQECMKTFQQQDSLTRHVFAVHSKGASKDLELFTSKNSIEHARIRKGWQDSGRWCSLCGKIFSSRHGLKIHLIKHSERSYACEVCKKRFTYKNNADKCHAKFYPCGKCEKQFKEISELQKHELEHKPKVYSCDICRKRFKGIKMLKIHMQAHKISQNTLRSRLRK